MGLVTQMAAGALVEPHHRRRAAVGAAPHQRQAPPEMSVQHR